MEQISIHIALRTNKACILAKRAKPMKIVYPSYNLGWVSSVDRLESSDTVIRFMEVSGIEPFLFLLI